jgi:hypothetical protein
MVSAVIEQDPSPTTIIYPLTAKEARELTYNINSQAEQLRQNLLKFYDGRGWIALGYDSFKAWAIAEFRFGFQHAYTLMRVARVENDLSVIEGETIAVPVNVGKQLSTLPSSTLQLEAYQVAQTHAATAGREVTEKDAIKAVRIVEKRELVRTSPYKVVAQMVNEDTISAKDGDRITRWLNQAPPATQLYVQGKMALGLKDLKVIHKVANRHREFVRNGKPSRNLTEIDSTGRIAGVPLDRATEKDWDRMASENQAAILSEIAEEKAIEQKKLAELAKEQGIELEPIVEPKAMNAYTNSPERTLDALKRVLDDKTLKGLVKLILCEQGYVRSSIGISVYAEDAGIPITDDDIDLELRSIPRNGLECRNGDTLELWMRVKR